MDTGTQTGISAEEGQRVEIVCRDGIVLGGHLWSAAGLCHGAVIINPATGVLASYYHRYARFLASHGFEVLTYDYRGIGLSRPASLRRCGYRWRDWGALDFEAALAFVRDRDPLLPVAVVGHSIGGFLPGFAESATTIGIMLTVGAQYGYWGDYEEAQRRSLFWKWHVTMLLLTTAFGYFPGTRLGWLEDLPAGVANEWSFRGARMECSYPVSEREEIVARFDAVTAPILAVSVSDDPIGTPAAIRRGLGYYRNAGAQQVTIEPGDLGLETIGHFSLFHQRHASGFWLDTVLWLRDGVNPWPDRLCPAPAF